MNSKFKKIIILIIVLAIVFIIGSSIYDNYKKQYEVEEVVEEKYLISIVDDRVGVVDKNSNIVIQPQYDEIQIPNPSKPIFVCFYDYNTDAGNMTGKQYRYTF